jgi:proteasome lid subunit RPN8/RPN11
MPPENQLILTRDQWRAMRRHVARRLPQEACGLLAGRGERVEITRGVPNAARSPVRFRMSPRAQLRAFQRIEDAGMELVGIYHSHPNGPDHPSPTDLAEAMYPVVYVLWYRRGGKWQARGFRIEAGKFRAVSLQVFDPQ